MRAPSLQSASSTRGATAALGVGVVLASSAAIVAASRDGSPVRVAGVERSDAWAVVFLASLAVAFVLYLAALYTLRSSRGQMALVGVVAVAIQLAPLTGPLLISRDAYSYWAYGRIVASHDRDPFTVAPARFPHDPATRAVAPAWRKQTSVYGPAFMLASAGVSEVSRNSAELASFLFRAAAAVAAIGATVLAALIARRKAFAAAFLGWNPVVAISFAGGGHNDAWMLVLMLAALALLARRRDTAAGVAWILAGAIKAPALAILLLQLLRSRRGLWLGAALATVAVGALATAVFGTAWLESIWRVNRWESSYSLPSRLEQLGITDAIAHALADVLLATGALWLGRQARRGRPRLALGASLLVVTSPWVLPWYSTWPVVLAAADDDALAQVVALGLAAYLLPARIPF